MGTEAWSLTQARANQSDPQQAPRWVTLLELNWATLLNFCWDKHWRMFFMEEMQVPWYKELAWRQSMSCESHLEKQRNPRDKKLEDIEQGPVEES